MPQGTVSAANALQQASGNAYATSVDVALPNPCQAGSTVTVLVSAGGSSFTDAGFGGTVPDGFEMDAVSVLGGVLRYLWAFRKRDVGGQQSWTFADDTTNTWTWWAIEWDQGLEPGFPPEAVAYNEASGAAVASLSTGTTWTTSRPNAVALAWHYWHRATASGLTFDWSGHTNGFVEQDQRLYTSTGVQTCSSWSWKFAQATGTFETTATVNISNTSASDVYAALIVVYAATTYA